MNTLDKYATATSGDFSAGSRFSGMTVMQLADKLSQAHENLDHAWQECLESALAAWFADSQGRADKLSYVVDKLGRSQPKRVPDLNRWFESFQNGYRIGRTKSGGYSVRTKPGFKAGQTPLEIGPIGNWFESKALRAPRPPKQPFDLSTGFDKVARQAYKLGQDENGNPVTREMAIAAFAKAYDRAMQDAVNK